MPKTRRVKSPPKTPAPKRTALAGRVGGPLAAPTSLATFAGRLRQARLDCGLSQAEAGQRIGGRASTSVSQWELAKTEPCLGDLAALAALYGVAVNWLVTGQPPRNTTTSTTA